MDIKSWKIMLAVDDYGSFTRVGAELGYTQSGITQMMKNLEKKVGFPLYIKDHHGITLTNEAKSLIPAIRTLLNADEVIHQEIAALNGAQRNHPHRHLSKLFNSLDSKDHPRIPAETSGYHHPGYRRG